MSHDNEICNRSKTRPFEDIMRASLSRRNVLKRSAVLSATGFMGAFIGDSLLSKGLAAAANSTAGTATGGTLLAQTSGLMQFSALKIADAVVNPAVPSISDDYTYQALIPWGTSFLPGGPEYTGDPNRRPTAAEQANQVGIGHDGIWFFGKDGISNTEGMLCVNHEFGRNSHVLGKDAPESLEDVRLSQHAHGVSVVKIKKQGGTWNRVASPNARRIHVNTPVEISGPAAGHELLQNAAGNA